MISFLWYGRKATEKPISLWKATGSPPSVSFCGVPMAGQNNAPIDKDAPMPNEVLRITQDRKVIVYGDIYDAARGFWEAVKATAPSGWTIERKD